MSECCCNGNGCSSCSCSTKTSHLEHERRAGRMPEPHETITFAELEHALNYEGVDASVGREDYLLARDLFAIATESRSSGCVPMTEQEQNSLDMELADPALHPIPSCACTTPHPSYAKNRFPDGGAGIGGNMIAAFCASPGCGMLHPLVASDAPSPT